MIIIITTIIISKIIRKKFDNNKIAKPKTTTPTKKWNTKDENLVLKSLSKSSPSINIINNAKYKLLHRKTIFNVKS